MRRISLFIQRALVMLAGVLLLGVSPALAQVAVNLPSVTGEAGTSGQIPITVGDLTGQNVLSYEFTVTYDPAVLNITGANIGGTVSETDSPTLTVNTSVEGQVSVAFASTTPLSGSGTLINLDADFLAQGNTALSFANFQFNEGDPGAVLTEGTAGVPEVAIRVPADTSATLGDTAFVIPVTTEAIPAGKSVLSFEFTLSFDPSVVEITGASAEGTLSEGFTVQANTATAGQITVAAAGTEAIPAGAAGTLINLEASIVGAGSSALTFSAVQFNEGDPDAGGISGQITVQDVNLAPTFTAELPDTTIRAGQTLTFQYTATDPNDDELTFSLIDPPAGATIDAQSGLFTFTPTSEQAGTHEIVAVVSDGEFADTSRTAVVIVEPVFTRGANLAGVHETPPVLSTGSGSATVEVRGDSVFVTGSFSGLTAQYTASHIHIAPVGVAGPVVVPLTATVSEDGRSGSYTLANNTIDLTGLTFPGGNTVESVRNAIRDGNAYVNVHSTAYPPGEIRGQLLPVPNRAPGASSITSPSDAQRFVIEGDPAALLFNFAWEEATDPDGNDVAYIIQLATDQAFTDVIDSQIFPAAVSLPITGADAAALFDLITGGFPGNVHVGEERTVYARVITTDGSLWTTGPRSSVVLERQSLTDRELDGMLPEHFALHGNYPNPFNPSTTIRFDLPASSEVSVQVVDLLGRQVMVVPSQTMAAGANRTLQLDAASLASGVYLYRVVARSGAETNIKTGRMTLLK